MAFLGAIKTWTNCVSSFLQPVHCTASRCLGSLMMPYGGEAPPKRPYGVPREPEEVKVHAGDFFQQYYGSMKL